MSRCGVCPAVKEHVKKVSSGGSTQGVPTSAGCCLPRPQDVIHQVKRVDCPLWRHLVPVLRKPCSAGPVIQFRYRYSGRLSSSSSANRSFWCLMISLQGTAVNNGSATGSFFFLNTLTHQCLIVPTIRLLWSYKRAQLEPAGCHGSSERYHSWTSSVRGPLVGFPQGLINLVQGLNLQEKVLSKQPVLLFDLV